MRLRMKILTEFLGDLTREHSRRVSRMKNTTCALELDVKGLERNQRNGV